LKLPGGRSKPVINARSFSCSFDDHGTGDSRDQQDRNAARAILSGFMQIRMGRSNPFRDSPPSNAKRLLERAFDSKQDSLRVPMEIEAGSGGFRQAGSFCNRQATPGATGE
jgi:hypothetical protein